MNSKMNTEGASTSRPTITPSTRHDDAPTPPAAAAAAAAAANTPRPPAQVPQPVREDDAESARLCEKWVASALSSSTSIQFLLNNLIESGCEPPEQFIRCVQCKQPQAGGFGMVVEETEESSSSAALTTNNTKGGGGSVQQCHRTFQDIQEQLKSADNESDGKTKLKLEPEIFVCQQYMSNEKMVHKTIHHELIHAVDLCRTKMDPLRNCIHLACTEIRAENLSGECNFWKELFYWQMEQFRFHGQTCVKRRAILSVRANPRCTDRAEEYVDAAMPRCFRDYYPYDRHPNER